MNYPTHYYINLSLIFIDIAIGCIYLKKIPANYSIIVYLLILSLLSETGSIICAKTIKSTFPVYHVYNVIESIIISIFFFKTTNLKNKANYIALSLIMWPLLGIANMAFLQPFRKMNSNFIMLESLIVIAMAMYSLYKILINDLVVKPLRNADFCLWVLFLFSNCGTFSFFASFRWIRQIANDNRNLLLGVNGWVNVIFYLGIGTVLILLSKTKWYEYR